MQARHCTLGHRATFLLVQLSTTNASKHPNNSDSTDAELPRRYTFGSMFISVSTWLLHQSAFMESVHTKPRQWEVCSKGIRGNLYLISLRGLISKIISYTEQKELPGDLWVSQLLLISDDAIENSTG